MPDPGLSFGPPKNKKTPLSLICVAVCLVGIILPICPSAQASETKTDLEKIIEDVAYGRKISAHARIDAYLKLHPDDVDVLCLKASYILLNDKTAEADRLYRRAIAVSPKCSRAVAGLSFCQINEHDYKNAYLNATKAAALYKVDPIYPFPDLGLLKNLNVLCLKSGRSQEAAEWQLKIKEYNMANRARTYREQGVLDKSLEVLNALLKADPKVPYALLLRGVAYNNKSEHAKAIKDFDAAIALQPTMVTAYYLRGDSYFDMGNKAKALESWGQLLQVHPTSHPQLVAFCFTAMTGRFREHFEPNDEMIVNRADVYYLLGVADTDLRHYEQAVKDYSQCIALDHGEYKAYFERAAVNGRLNRDSQVMADLDQAIKLNGNYIEALLERAKISEKKHENARAMADFTRVIAVNPSDFGSYILRADLAMRIKNYEQALSDYTQAIKLSPSDDDPLMGRAKVYTAQARYDDALADYKKAMRLNPQDMAVVLDAIARVEKLKKSGALSVR
jgi:tetratricopeptide (TPR) repeat protein